ncbi:MAG: hypothetical protein KGH60_02590 [Candidatus Micrarchaeota archaeon]|nr:hypothetical protein [Candidatus Micrarchaeota archaeon]
MVKRRGFSLYDIEEYLKEAGAERVNEKAVMSLERELQETVNELVEEAAVYADYAGRKRLIKRSDIKLVVGGAPRNGRYVALKKRVVNKRVAKPNEKAMLAMRLNAMVATAARDTS